MVYGYIRVSSDKQTVENQRFEIINFCEKKGVAIDGWIEETISGTKSYNKRALGRLLKRVKKDDLIICAEISRLGRNLFMIMEILNICMNKGCKVWSIKDGYRLGEDIQSKVLAFAFGLSAEIERNLISQRTKEALSRKRAEGVILGRRKGCRNKFPNQKCLQCNTKINLLLEKGFSIAKIAKKVKVSRGTLYRYLLRTKNELFIIRQTKNMDKQMRIVYMGTPEFAVEPLRRLVEGGYNVVGVITMPDKPAGRGYNLQPSAVKVYAESVGLNILQPVNLKDEEFLAELRALKADLQIVVAFRMLPEVVWNMPELGTFNLHASLLPQYRGAAPINWAVINGETETGVTTFFLKHEIDTGNIILQRKIAIEPTDNVGIVYDKLMNIGGDLVIETVDRIIEGNLETIPQDESIELKPAPKIFKDTCKIDWNKPSVEIHNLIRGLSPYPAAFTEVKDDKDRVLGMKIYESEVLDETSDSPAGTLISDGKTLKMVTADGVLKLIKVQLAGKKAMMAEDLLRGTKIFNL